MVWSPPRPLLNNPLYPVLSYSDQFNYPLTPTELWFWQIKTNLPQKKLNFKTLPSFKGFHFLPGRKQIVSLRLSRQKHSQIKWHRAEKVGEYLKRIPTISAIFVTGSLSMNNCPEHDDIDFMLVTSPHTLWITRALVVTLLRLKKWRREPYLPEHSSRRVSGKICDNLWLDTRHLHIPTHNLYTAHEILQARCLWDKGGVSKAFLTANPWVKHFLPVAYAQFQKQVPTQSLASRPLQFIFFPLNVLFYLFQLIYMFPKITSEKVSLGYAFFHPNSSQT